MQGNEYSITSAFSCRDKRADMACLAAFAADAQTLTLEAKVIPSCREKIRVEWHRSDIPLFKVRLSV